MRKTTKLPPADVKAFVKKARARQRKMMASAAREIEARE